MTLETKGSGRMLMVAFKCIRCNKTIALPFDDVMKGENYGYLHNSELPKGWEDFTGHGKLLCDECLKAFNDFIKAGRSEAEE